MKKFIISIICALCLGAAFAAGENVATSKAFVDSAVAQKQDKIPANSGTAQVLTNTGTAGTVGTKDIYSASGEYAAQMDSLVDAATMNAAVQTAIDAEFECIEWNPRDSTDCWLVQIKGVSELPSGYTQLEYLESTGDQCIDTNVVLSSNNVVYDFEMHNKDTRQERSFFGAEAYNGDRWVFSGIMYFPRTADELLPYLGYGNIGSVSVPNNTDSFHKWRWVINPNHTTYIIRDGTNIVQSNWTGDLNQQTNIHLYCNLYEGQSMSQKTKAAFKSFKITDNGNVVFNGIPARNNTTGKAGMYDTVTNTFFTNSFNNTDFIAGPVASFLPSGN